MVLWFHEWPLGLEHPRRLLHSMASASAGMATLAGAGWDILSRLSLSMWLLQCVVGPPLMVA